MLIGLGVALGAGAKVERLGPNIAPALSTYVAGGTHTSGEVVGETIVLNNTEYAFRSGLSVTAGQLYKITYNGTGTPPLSREAIVDYDNPSPFPIVKYKLGSAIQRVQVTAVGDVTMTEISVRAVL